MVVDHIQDSPHTTFMDFVDEIFEFGNSFFWILRIARVHTSQGEVVLRVISPVVVAVA